MTRSRLTARPRWLYVRDFWDRRFPVRRARRYRQRDEAWALWRQQFRARHRPVGAGEPPDGDDPQPSAVSGRLTDQAKRAAVLAQDEARRLGHYYVGPEHILLGLIHECIGAKALKSLGISLDAVRQQVEEIIGHGEGEPDPSGHIPWTPRARKVLELSLREAQQLGENYIGSEHILLGLIAEGEDVAAQVLVRLGADLSRARQQVIRLLDGQDVEAGHSEPEIWGASRAAGGLPVGARRSLGLVDSTDAGTGTGRRYLRLVISRDKSRWLPAISVTAPELRVSDPARRVLAQAQDEAGRLIHNYVGTEHILLGVLHDGESAAVRTLLSLGVEPVAVRQQVEEIIGTGTRSAYGRATSPLTPLTPRARKVLELSRREALRLGDRVVGTEHVLLGLIAEGEGAAGQVLVRLGADLGRVRRYLLDGHDVGEPGNTWPSGW